jgi:rsbT co-antagonist protein RsbR
MEIIYNQREKMTDFIRDNKHNFQDKLLSEEVNVASKINNILKAGNIDLLKNELEGKFAQEEIISKSNKILQ